MKKIMICIFGAIFLLTACQSDEDAFNVEGFTAVKNYVDEMIPLVDGLLESEDKLIIEKVEETNESLYIFHEEDEYNQNEMKDWVIELGLEEGEWKINGEDLYNELDNLYEATNQYTKAYNEDKVTSEVKEALRKAREDIGDTLRK